jgi:hypothetical protein
MACFDMLASIYENTKNKTYAGSMMTGGFSVELPFIQPTISELSWLAHSIQEWAETAVIMAAEAAIMFFILIVVVI